MYDLSSSNLQSGLQSFLVDYNTGRNHFHAPLISKKKISLVSFKQSSQCHEFRYFLRILLILVKCENYLFTKSYAHVAVISIYSESIKLARSRTSNLIRIQGIRVIMNHQPETGFHLWVRQLCFQF